VTCIVVTILCTVRCGTTRTAGTWTHNLTTDTCHQHSQPQSNFTCCHLTLTRMTWIIISITICHIHKQLSQDTQVLGRHQNIADCHLCSVSQITYFVLKTNQRMLHLSAYGSSLYTAITNTQYKYLVITHLQLIKLNWSHLKLLEKFYWAHNCSL